MMYHANEILYLYRSRSNCVLCAVHSNIAKVNALRNARNVHRLSDV